MSKNITELMDQLDTLEDISLIIDKILECKEYLASVSPDQLTVNQKLWLLAFEASESKLVKMTENNNEANTKSFSESVATLRQAVVGGLLK